IDLDPARGGKLGQMFEWAHDGGPIGGVAAPSYGTLFARFVRELKEGRYRYLSSSPSGHARLDRKEDQRVAQMIEEVDRIVSNPRWKEPFEIEGCDLISKISFLWLIAHDTRLSLLEPAKVEHWK